jgi:ubiquitin carboxyl-terminal hydrolase L3
VANSVKGINPGNGTPLKELLRKTKNVLIGERTHTFMEMPEIRACHDACAGATGLARRRTSRSQTSAEATIGHHFITYICHEGFLYELDGQKPFPLRRGPSSPQSFLADAAREVKTLFQSDEGNHSFSLLALVKGS